MKGNKNITTGCGSDLRQTTQIAYALARSLAMRDNIMISMEKNNLSDGMNYMVDKESQRIIQVDLGVV
jgi:ATP-dependent metalloprotease